MCGRFAQSLSAEQIARYFGAEPRVDDDGNHYNVAPTQNILAVIEEDGQRIVTTARWGLIPPWADNPQIGSRMINARGETVAEKPAFRAAFRRQRCIIPAAAFYEWKTVGGRKIPHAITRRDGKPMAFAGLWSTWRDPATGETIRTATIITTSANEVLAPLHDRMPVILPEESWDAWLDPGFDNVGALRSMLGPCPADDLRAYPVSPRVNNVHNDGPDLLGADEGVSAPPQFAEPC